MSETASFTSSKATRRVAYSTKLERPVAQEMPLYIPDIRI